MKGKLLPADCYFGYSCKEFLLVLLLLAGVHNVRRMLSEEQLLFDSPYVFPQG